MKSEQIHQIREACKEKLHDTLMLPSTDVLIGMDIISMGRFLLEPKPDGGTKFMFIL